MKGIKRLSAKGKKASGNLTNAETEHLDGLTLKQRKLVEVLASGEAKSQKEAMLAAGYEAGNNVTHTTKNSKIIEALRIELERRGITTELIGEVLHDGLTAREDHNDPASKPERIVRLKYYEKIANILGLENSQENSQNFSWENLVQNVQINYNADRNASD